MNKYISDTMAYVLYLEKRKMPEKIKQLFMQAEKSEIKIEIPSIVLAEIAYLSEKKRIDVTLENVQQHLENSQFFTVRPLDFEIILSSFQIDDIPELHDRLIAGTAKFLNSILITNDPAIEKSKFIDTIWK